MYGTMPYLLFHRYLIKKCSKYGSVEFVFVKDCGIFTVHKRTSHVKEIPRHKPQTGEFLELWYIGNKMNE